MRILSIGFSTSVTRKLQTEVSEYKYPGRGPEYAVVAQQTNWIQWWLKCTTPMRASFFDACAVSQQGWNNQLFQDSPQRSINSLLISS